MKRRYIVQLCLALLLCCPSLLKAQSSQTNFQYWIDDNKDEAVYGTANGEDIDLSIDVSALSPGVHFYNMRAYETVGTKNKWGTTYRYLFCIPRLPQETGGRLITGYSYSFDGNSPTNVVFDAPVEEYSLNTSLSVPQSPLPMVIDDDCSFIFDEDENTATLSRNVNMSFALYFKDQGGAIGSPVTTNFVVADEHSEAVQNITCPGSATIVSHEGGGFSAVRFDVATKKNLKLTANGNCSLRLFSPYSQLLESYDASSLLQGATRKYEEGTYYAIVFGNPEEVKLTIGLQKVCGYAIIDHSTETMTFKYGPMPTGENVYEMEDTHYYTFVQVDQIGTTTLTLAYDCSNIKSVVFEPSFKQARPKSTAYWFYHAQLLESIVGLENLNTSEVTDMNNMFSGCSSLSSLDLSHFDTGNVINMGYLFYKCYSLTNIDLTGFDTKNVTDMSFMFGYCSSLTSIEFGDFDTCNTINMQSMFISCSNLSVLDLSNFNTSNLKIILGMFSDCSNLTTIYVSDSWTTANVKWTYLTRHPDLFKGCMKLVGGEGTQYNPDIYESPHTEYVMIDKKYVRIDGGADSPGYFTYKGATTLLIGDVNGDGSISVTDVGMMISYILGQNPAGFNKDAADLNGDGTISVTDVGALITKILTGE